VKWLELLSLLPNREMSVRILDLAHLASSRPFIINGSNRSRTGLIAEPAEATQMTQTGHGQDRNPAAQQR
jgi:hypothetical protein